MDEQQSPPESTTQTWDLEDQVATEFENALIRGEKPSIRKAVECVEPEALKRLLAELVGIEIVHRRRAGDRVDLADYEADFPELRSLTPEARGELINVDHPVNAESPTVESDIHRPLHDRSFDRERRAG